MAKAIIKLNIHLPEKQFSEFVKTINNQLKNDIIYVPYFCEVYVIDGDPELKVENRCDMCKCRSKWEAKDDTVTNTSSNANGRL